MNRDSIVKIIGILLAGVVVGGGAAYAVMPKGGKTTEKIDSIVVSSVKTDKTEKQKVSEASNTKSNSENIDNQPGEGLSVENDAVKAVVLSGKAGELQKKILRLNQDNKVPRLNIYKKVKVNKGKHDWWRDEPFLLSEGLKAEILPEDAEDEYVYKNKNDCKLIRKQFVNSESDNIIELEIYYNPETEMANKITSIEYLQNGKLEITEYYYYKAKKGWDKKISFIARRTVDEYVNSFIAQNNPGTRYYFRNNNLNTIRVVDNNGSQANYMSSKYNDKRNLVNKRSEEAYRSAQGKTYRQEEKRMLNAAYNIYKAAMNEDGFSMVEGFVYDENKDGIGNADLELALYNGDVLYKTKTENDGRYKIYLPSEDKTYSLKFLKDGMKEVSITEVTINDNIPNAYQDAVYLFANTDVKSDVNIKLGDAVEKMDNSGMIPLDGAEIIIREGFNNMAGDILTSLNADYDGNIRINLLPGIYTAEINKEGYEIMYYNFIVKTKSSENTYSFFAPKTLREGEVKVVLTWGSNPSDLDSHLFTERYTGTSSSVNEVSHVWYAERDDSYHSNLDVDDTDSYGPETVTIMDLNSNKYFKYGVVDYTNFADDNYGSYDMSYSDATVKVYSKDGLVGSFHVPEGRKGIIWEVFEIRGDKRIVPTQRYYSGYNEVNNWLSKDK